MATQGRLLSWYEALRGEPLPADVRVALARRVVRWVLVPLWTTAIAAVALVWLTAGSAQPSRLAPAAVGFPMLALVTYLTRRGDWLSAAGWLNISIFTTITVGVLLNGIDAPLYGLGFLLLAVVIPLFGNRWGATTAAALGGIGVLWLALDLFGLAHARANITPATRAGLHLCFLWLTLICLGGINRLLTEALRDASRERAEADQARAAEAASGLAFHAVFDQAGVGMVLLTPTGSIVELNERAATWLGVDSPRALVGLGLEAVPAWGPAQRQTVVDAVAAASGGSRSQHELVVKSQLGALRTYQLSVSPFYTPSGAVGHVSLEIVEVSDLVDTRTQLAQARRLEALGKLSGGVAHDINNMLAAILGAAELVQIARSHGDMPRLDAGLQNIHDAVTRAGALTKQLLAFGRQNRFASMDIDVNALAVETGCLFERTLHRNIQVVVIPAQQPAFIRGDVAALEHALLNLGLNAQDAMPNGGRLTLEVLLQPLDAIDAARLHWNDAGAGAVVLRVSDTGAGMSESVRERLFEPFFTTKEVGKGTGLGLAAVHGTVRNHRGAISVSSAEDMGSSFELYFPASEPGAASWRAKPMERPAALRLHAHVLLADDESMVRGALTALLIDSGCSVRAVADGTALISALEAGETPDVIVTDLIMPGLSGNKLLHALQELRPGCPMLLLTGYIGSDISTALADTDRCRLLRKPVLRSELHEALSQLLASREHNPVPAQSA